MSTVVEINEREYNVSDYNPGKDVATVLDGVRGHYEVGWEIMNRKWRQLNDMSVRERSDECQKRFNSYKPPRSQDDDTRWRAQTVRPIVRNRITSVAAHITANTMFPKVFAQNDRDEADRAAAGIMRDLIQWSADQSNYERTTLYSIIAALVNPASIVYTGYHEVMRKRRIENEDGEVEISEEIDDRYSGFQDEIVPVDELFIGNIFEHDIQKQPFLIWRRVIDYFEAKSKYGDNPNFTEYVQPGINLIYSPANDLFYEQYDEAQQGRKVEEVIYYNRDEDLELIVVNGVLMSSHNRPIQRRDGMYPFIKYGYGLIDEGKFFYFKSLADQMLDDADLIDKFYNIVLDGSYLDAVRPMIAFGDEEFDSSVMIPGSITHMSQESKAQVVETGNNLNAAFNALSKIESSASESSVDLLQSGQAMEGDQTAFEISRLEQNARVQLGLFGKQIALNYVKPYGMLRMGDILQHMTVGELDAINGDKLKYRSFLLEDQVVDGKTKNKQIVFNPEMPMGDISESEYLELSRKILEEEGDLDGEKKLYMVNPMLFRQMKYKMVVDADIIFPRSDAVKKSLNLEAYDRAIGNPLVNQEAILRDFLLENYVPGETDKYIKTEEELQAEAQRQAGAQAQQRGPGGLNTAEQLAGGADQQIQKELEIEKTM